MKAYYKGSEHSLGCAFENSCIGPNLILRWTVENSVDIKKWPVCFTAGPESCICWLWAKMDWPPSPVCFNHGVVKAVPGGTSAEFEVQLSFSLFVLLTLCRRYLNSLCSKCNCKMPDIKCKDTFLWEGSESQRDCEESIFSVSAVKWAESVCSKPFDFKEGSSVDLNSR